MMMMPLLAPVIAWNHGPKETEQPQDRWSKTYVSPKKSSSSVQSSVSTSSSTTASFTSNSASTSTSSSSTSIPASVTTRKFPRPKSTPSVSSRPLSRGINEHILATTSQSPRPPSPLKFSTTFSDPTSDILPSLSSNEPSLSKVYGSVLQPKETLPLHSCVLCSAIFLPDATIYPNPSETFDGKTFVCRQCFTTNGGSKGNCPSCSRPVLALKAEGGFIQSGGKYWHKGCFTCVGCFKNIGGTPMVDLFGRPTCAECFDNCLKRDHPVTPKKGRISNNNSPSLASPGGLSSSYGRKSREGSPMIDELEQRLGIVRSRECSPAVVDLGRSAHDSPTRNVSTPLELSNSNTRRYPKMDDQSPSKSTKSPRLTPYTSTTTNVADSPLRRSFSELQQSQIRSISSSPRLSTSERADLRQNDGSNDMTVFDLGEISTASSRDPTAAKISRACISSPATVKSGSVCDKCQKPILNSRQGGHFVTIPGLDENDSPKLYHSDCFKCTVCDKTVGENKKGQTSFVLASVGPCHVQVCLIFLHSNTWFMIFCSAHPRSTTSSERCPLSSHWKYQLAIFLTLPSQLHPRRIRQNLCQVDMNVPCRLFNLRLPCRGLAASQLAQGARRLCLSWSVELSRVLKEHVGTLCVLSVVAERT